MPIYDFACSRCGHGFERLQKLSDADPTVCPACGQGSVSRKVTAPSFRLAGSGWYETDFKTGNKKNLVGGGEGSGTADKSASSSSGDSKSGESKGSDSKPSDSKSGDSNKTA